MDEKKNLINETVHLYAREKIELVGAVEVISSTANEAVVKLEEGLVVVSGDKITISKLVPEEKFLVLSGKIKGITFEEKTTKKSLLKKVFK